MHDRLRHKHDFLHKSGITDYRLQTLEADASFRSYDRVITKSGILMLMDSPPEHYSLHPFINIAAILRAHNLAAPKIFHIDHVHGFMLLEDFGSIRMKDYLTQNPELLSDSYKNIIDVLIRVQKIPASEIQTHSIDTLLRGLEVFVDWYLQEQNPHYKERFISTWQNILNIQHNHPKVLTLRDFHVENLMYLPEQNIGLLDFQDASLSHPAYDLVSLLEDARHDVPENIAREMLQYYLATQTDLNHDDFMLCYNILGAQRNSRILGYFVRKVRRDKQKKYLQFMPRVYQYLMRDLAHPALGELRILYEQCPKPEYYE
jgi:aminoglycoside/choline kinase family phosphotransferase